MAFDPLRQSRENIEAIRPALAYRPGDKLSPEASVERFAPLSSFLRKSDPETIPEHGEINKNT